MQISEYVQIPCFTFSLSAETCTITYKNSHKDPTSAGSTVMAAVVVRKVIAMKRTKMLTLLYVTRGLKGNNSSSGACNSPWEFGCLLWQWEMNERNRGSSSRCLVAKRACLSTWRGTLRRLHQSHFFLFADYHDIFSAANPITPRHKGPLCVQNFSPAQRFTPAWKIMIHHDIAEVRRLVPYPSPFDWTSKIFSCLALSPLSAHPWECHSMEPYPSC